jgi:SAM-dependent methyltransferase
MSAKYSSDGNSFPMIGPLIKTVLPAFAVRLLGNIRDRIHVEMYRRNPIPWSHGYNATKHKFIDRVLRDPATIELFRSNHPLALGYGRGLDERCVEYPWLISRLSPDEGTLLDAGSALNFGYLLHHPTIAAKSRHIITLAPEPVCLWSEGISYCFGDLRDPPFRDSFFDTIVCISTLEHIGCDNSDYTGIRATDSFDAGDMYRALEEMWRMLKKSGTLFLTVPFGRRRDYGKFQQFDHSMLKAVLRVCSGAEVREEFFLYGNHGWQHATASACGDCEYADASSNAQHKDNAAAARAVACITLRKQLP